MKKLILLFISLLALGAFFQACDDTKTYAEMLEEERDGVNDFIKKNNIEVITVEEFEKDTITECEDGYPVQYPGKNQYVAFSNGIYMQIVQRYGTPRAASEPYPNLEAALPFETGNLILTRFKEVDILTGEPTSVSNVDNQYYPPMNNYPTGFRYTIDGTSIYGQFIQEPGLDSEYYWDVTIGGQYGTSVPAGWLMALQYIKAHADILGIPEDAFEKWNVHIHVPEGAIPKDGPSAGITMATSLASAFTQRKVKARLAMTGEITLRGKVLTVGAIKEKILAAKRSGIKEVILSEENRKDIEEINEMYLKGLTFHYVNTIKDVWDIALTSQKVPHALKIE